MITTTTESLPLILFDADLCALFSISRTTLRKLRRLGAFPIAPMPALDKRARYSRSAVERFIEGGGAMSLRRRA